MRTLADVVTTDSTAIATLITALGGLVAAVGALLTILLTHKQVKSVKGTVRDVKSDTAIIKNGYGNHDDTGSSASI